MRLPSGSVRGLSALTAALLAFGLAGCGGGDTPDAAPTGSASPSASTDPNPDARNQLAGMAALAMDRRYAALYSFTGGDGVARNVVATVANDGTWRVDIANGALGGSADVSIVHNPNGVYQCTVSMSGAPINAGCVHVASKGEKVPAPYDPRVQRLLRQWLPVFTDRNAALAVSVAQPLDGTQGSACYSVDSNAASGDAPVDVGVYCYAPDGMLTAARVGFGVLRLVRQVAAPPTVQFPGPEVGGAAMGMSAADPVQAPSAAAG
ncbi:hypothetical protein ACWT_7992 [Actinoplanes sp. SE50]|uniref:hypothetical protein n=1 Tax=unclassified Actinoplanes TaxID=2626549 RepID=UPI00023EE086|nr:MULTISPECIES: hypothetical protein [unclassified Actinoplanes]AEV89001.1 hypothetical protein ACPL_8123 [Actinoplanes sp. SE50/110]ATO87407.1 hypothetical protein ACWT_7992 [Actinoplanes sp. SE50]SLM04825.1 hypothetical protein ACSP50_8134 [Actinoplanes sp. SE50/110]